MEIVLWYAIYSDISSSNQTLAASHPPQTLWKFVCKYVVAMENKQYSKWKLQRAKHIFIVFCGKMRKAGIIDKLVRYPWVIQMDKTFFLNHKNIYKFSWNYISITMLYVQVYCRCCAHSISIYINNSSFRTMP